MESVELYIPHGDVEAFKQCLIGFHESMSVMSEKASGEFTKFELLIKGSASEIYDLGFLTGCLKTTRRSQETLLDASSKQMQESYNNFMRIKELEEQVKELEAELKSQTSKK